MNDEKKLLIKDYLSNMKVGVSDIGYMKVTPEWRDIDYVPNYNKFYFICEGEGYLKINGVEYFPKPGQLFLMPSGVMQSYSIINENTFLKYWCHFTANIGDMNLFDDVLITTVLEDAWIQMVNYMET
jgi:AraC family transcriptional regulator, arabinose operon regulatory protein